MAGSVCGQQCGGGLPNALPVARGAEPGHAQEEKVIKHGAVGRKATLHTAQRCDIAAQQSTQRFEPWPTANLAVFWVQGQRPGGWCD